MNKDRILEIVDGSKKCFVPINPNLILKINDERALTANEFCLYCILLFNAPHFKIIKKYQQKRLGWKDDRFNSAWKSLVEKGLITKNGEGRSTNWEIYRPN